MASSPPAATPGKVAAAVGDHPDLLAIKLDVNRPADAQAAVEAAVRKFGRIDILVNNAGNFYAGFFSELSPEQVRNQIETLLFGPMNVTRAFSVRRENLLSVGPSRSARAWLRRGTSHDGDIAARSAHCVKQAP